MTLFVTILAGENTCYVAGDPHFKTFDGAIIQFQGVCTYTLAKPDSRKLGILSDFNVEIKNEHRDGEMKLSWAKSVKLTIYNLEILLDREGVVYVSIREAFVDCEFVEYTTMNIMLGVVAHWYSQCLFTGG